VPRFPDLSEEAPVIGVTRTRLSFTGEWLTAALFLAATAVVAMLVVRELRVAPQAFAGTSAADAATAVASVPAEAVSVPALMLGAHEIRVGDSARETLSRLDGSILLVKQTDERGPLGPRQIRSYQLAGSGFILVFEPFERAGELRVAAIYLQ
jgi:hypothetical protein